MTEKESFLYIIVPIIYCKLRYYAFIRYYNYYNDHWNKMQKRSYFSHYKRIIVLFDMFRISFYYPTSKNYKIFYYLLPKMGWEEQRFNIRPLIINKITLNSFCNCAKSGSLNKLFVITNKYRVSLAPSRNHFELTTTLWLFKNKFKGQLKSGKHIWIQVYPI